MPEEKAHLIFPCHGSSFVTLMYKLIVQDIAQHQHAML